MGKKENRKKNMILKKKKKWKRRSSVKLKEDERLGRKVRVKVK